MPVRSFGCFLLQLYLAKALASARFRANDSPLKIQSFAQSKERRGV